MDYIIIAANYTKLLTTSSLKRIDADTMTLNMTGILGEWNLMEKTGAFLSALLTLCL